MRVQVWLCGICWSVVWALTGATDVSFGQVAGSANAPERRVWMVDGVEREGLLHVPKSMEAALPVVFAFHGHGGTMERAARMFGYHKLWPEAIVVYLQGLNTPGRLTDPEGKRPGWQHAVGEQGDRDLRLFDVVLESLRRDYRVDDRRVYATGHSNGGGFTYLLWSARGETLAAVAPSGSAAGRRSLDLRPKPVLHVAGKADPLVRFEWQQATIEQIRRVNRCGEGDTDEDGYTVYASEIGMPVETFIHPGGHRFPAQARPKIVKFFQSHAKPES